MDSPSPVRITRILPADDAGIAAAAALIRAAEPVAVATETVYGLAADATTPAAVAAIYAAKGRPSFNPLIVHVPDLHAAHRLGEFDARAQVLAETFWPGPLTLVLPRRATSGIARLATAGLDTVALRVPAHPAMQALLTATGRPLAAPSANASGKISPTRAAHVLASLGGRISLILDSGATERGIESSIVACAGNHTRVLRQGPITTHDMITTLQAAEGIGIRNFDASLTTAETKIEAPGQMWRHYAPSKPVRLEARRGDEGEWMIGFGDVSGDATLSADGNLVDAAARLFDLLHQADASDARRIAVAHVPMNGLGAAINDRLRRAAHRD